jgi:hypothetical protein
MKTYKITLRKEDWNRYYADLVVAVPDGVDPMTLFSDDDGGDLQCEVHNAIDEWAWQNGEEDEEIVGASETDSPPDVVVTRDADGCLMVVA